MDKYTHKLLDIVKLEQESTLLRFISYLKNKDVNITDDIVAAFLENEKKEPQEVKRKKKSRSTGVKKDMEAGGELLQKEAFVI